MDSPASLNLSSFLLLDPINDKAAEKEAAYGKAGHDNEDDPVSGKAFIAV